MKRIFNRSNKAMFSLLLALLTGLAACKKEQVSPAQTALEQSIQTASSVLSAAKEGTNLGDFAPGSKSSLQTQIDWANFIKGNSGTDLAYTNAKTTLDAAVATFKTSTVKPGTPKFGINAYYELGPVEKLVKNKTAFTIEVNAKLTDLNTDGTAKLGAFITIDDKNKGILFRYTNTGAVAAYIYNGGYKGATTAANSLVPGQLYHLTYTYDGATITVYINGNKAASASAGGTGKDAQVDDGSPVRLGMSRNNVWTVTDLRCMHGNLTEVRFWDHALTQAEVTQYKDKPLVGNESGLVAYWPFDLNLGLQVPAKAGSFTAVGTNVTWE